MTKESLMQMGLTDEQATKVMEALNGAFVPKSRFNEVNTELQNAKNTIKERDTQLEELKKSTGDVKALNDKITALQNANAEQKKAHDTEMKALKISNAVEMALTTAKAKNNVAARALLAEFLTKAELAEDGTVKGLDAEIKKLVEGESTAFLFDKAESKPIEGAKPAEKSDVPPSGTGADLSKMTYEELTKYLEEHPDVQINE